MVTCNSSNVQTPTPKPNPPTFVNVPHNTHYRTLTNLQNEKMSSNLTNRQFFFINPFAKTPISKRQTNTTHMGIFLGQVSMHNYSSSYPFASTIVIKGTVPLFLVIFSSWFCWKIKEQVP
jgi:hypothetical protein